VFHIDVVKVDRSVAHIIMVILVCFKCRYQIFHLFQIYVASVLSRCYKSRFGCCIYIQVFQMFLYVYCKCFHLNVYNICNVYTRGFKFFYGVLLVFQTYVASVSTVSDVCCKYFI
jgi:hypothetical protein